MHLYCTSTTQRAPGVPGLPEAARHLTADGQSAPASGCLMNGGFLRGLIELRDPSLTQIIACGLAVRHEMPTPLQLQVLPLR